MKKLMCHMWKNDVMRATTGVITVGDSSANALRFGWGHEANPETHRTATLTSEQRVVIAAALLEGVESLQPGEATAALVAQTLRLLGEEGP